MHCCHQPVSSRELISLHCLPDSLIGFYVQEKELKKTLRAVRQNCHEATNLFWGLLFFSLNLFTCRVLAHSKRELDGLAGGEEG